MMHLQIISPNNKIFDGEVESITAPGKDGSFQILQNHAPLVSSLKNGVVCFRTKTMDTVSSKLLSQNSKGELEFSIKSGILENNNNKIILLVE